MRRSQREAKQGGSYASRLRMMHPDHPAFNTNQDAMNTDTKQDATVTISTRSDKIRETKELRRRDTAQPFHVPPYSYSGIVGDDYIMAKHPTTGDRENVAIVWQFQDKEYIVRACNAYPQAELLQKLLDESHEDNRKLIANAKYDRDKLTAHAERLAEALKKIERRTQGSDGSNQTPVKALLSIQRMAHDAVVQWEEEAQQ